MTTFFGILVALLFINAVLLIFSTNESKIRLKKRIKKPSKGSITTILPRQVTEGEYKKAV